MLFSEFSVAVRESFLSKFPNGHISIEKANSSVFINFGLIGVRSDCANGIRHNDPLHTILVIHDAMDYIGNMRDKLKMECVLGAALSCLPENKYYAMSMHKIGFRSTTGKANSALKSLDRLFTKARNLVNEKRDAGVIYNMGAIPKKYLEG